MNTQNQSSNTAPENAQSNNERFELSGNYFRDANAEFRRTIISGQFNDNTVNQVEERVQSSRTGFLDLIADFISDIPAASQWLITKFAGDWMVAQLDFLRPVIEARNTVMAIASDPMTVIDDQLEEFLNLPQSSFLGDIELEDLTQSTFLSGSLNALGDRGRIIGALIALKEYFRANPEAISEIPSDNNQALEYYRTILTQLNYADQTENAYGILTGQIELATVLASPTAMPENTTPEAEQTLPEREIDMTSANHYLRLNQYNRYKQATPEERQNQNIVSPYGETLVIDGIEQIHCQYYIDRARLAMDETANTVSDFVGDNTPSLVGLSALGLLIGLNSNPIRTLSGQAINSIHSSLSLAIRVGAVPLGLIGVMGAALFTYLSVRQYIPLDLNAFKEQFIEWLQTQVEVWSEIVEAVRPFAESAVSVIGDCFDLIYSEGQELATYLAAATTQLAEATGNAVATGIENMSQSPREFIANRNISMLNNLYRNLNGLNLRNIRQGEYVEADLNQNLQQFKLIIDEYEAGITQTIDIDNIRDLLLPLGIVVSQNPTLDGIYTWSQYNENGELITVAEPLLINPALNEDDQFEIANEFNFFGENMLNRTSDKLISDFQIILGRIIGEDPTNQDTPSLLRKLFTIGGSLQIIGNGIYVYGESGLTRFFVGPASVIGTLFGIGDGDGQLNFSIGEAFVEYADNLVPVTIFALPSLISASFSRHRSGWRVATNILTYPVSGPLAVARTIARVSDQSGRMRIANGFLTSINPHRTLSNLNTRARNLFRFRDNSAGLQRAGFMSSYYNSLNEMRILQTQLYDQVAGRTDTFNQASFRRAIASGNFDQNTHNRIIDRLNAEGLLTGTSREIETHDQARSYLAALEEEINIKRTITSQDLNRAWLSNMINQNSTNKINDAELNRLTSYFRNDPEISRFLSPDGRTFTDKTALSGHIHTLFSDNNRHLLAAPITGVSPNRPGAGPSPSPTRGNSGAPNGPTPPGGAPRRRLSRGAGGVLAGIGIGLAAGPLGRFLNNERETAEYEYSDENLEVLSTTDNSTEITTTTIEEIEATEAQTEDLTTTHNEAPTSQPTTLEAPANSDQELLRRNAETSQNLQTRFSDLLSSFNDPQTILNMSFHARTALYNQLNEANETARAEIESFTAQNINALYDFFAKPENTNKQIGFVQLGENFNLYNLFFEDNQVTLKYPSEAELRNFYWDWVDSIQGNLADRALRSTNLTEGSAAGIGLTDGIDLAARIAPYSGTALDLTDSYQYFRRGQLARSAGSLGWGLLGGALDVAGFFTVGATAAAGSGIRGLRFARNAAQLGRQISTGVNIGQAGVTFWHGLQGNFTSTINFPRPTAENINQPSSFHNV